MNGIVTQTRSLDKLLISHQLVGPKRNPWTEMQTVPGSQETTSYRSSPQESDDVLPSDLQVFQPARYVVGTSDSGHEFQTVKSSLLTTTNLSDFVTGYNGVQFRISGPALVVNAANWTAAENPPALTKNELIVLGGRAISATVPTKPEANLSQFLGELKRDGIPAITGNSLIYHPSARSLGGEYLNVEFGWKPLISDLQKLLNSVVHSTEILRQFRRDSGRIVRRRFSFPEQRSLVEYTPVPLDGGAKFVWPFTTSMFVSPGMARVSDLTQTNVWFKGAYSYYLDVGDSLMSKAEEFEQKANHLLGTRLTPDVLYDLSPWSWLADWFGNVGTALSNVSALQEDGLVIRYGYLMRHTVITRTVRAAPVLQGHDKPLPISTLFRTERKERWKATPYGFGLSFTGFNPRQWAILAALGMTKAPGIAK